MQIPLSVIKDGIYYSAGSIGKSISKESKKLFKEKSFLQKIQEKITDMVTADSASEYNYKFP